MGRLNTNTAPRGGSLVGNFVQPAGGAPAGTALTGIAGRFGISKTPGANVYRASGTLAAERKP